MGPGHLIVSRMKEHLLRVEGKPSSAEVKVLHSEELFGGHREVAIEHNGSFYRLMITKAGKLILNK